MTEQASLPKPVSAKRKAPVPSIEFADHSLLDKFLQLRKPFVPRAIFLGAIWLAICWLIHKYLLPPLPPFEQISGFDNLNALRFKFFESGWIPFAISLSFFTGFQYLCQIYFRLLAPLGFANAVDSEVIEAARGDDLNYLIKLLNHRIAAGTLGYYSKRFAKLLSRWRLDEDTGAVIALKNEILEIDEEDIALAFTTISWTEWTLPLLGFLGTVVGIGGAIGSVQNGVRLLFARGTFDPDVLNLFTQGFKGLALAFDTTFQGLAFLIIVGGLHFMIRKSLTSKLAAARFLFHEFVAKWFAVDDNPVVIAVGDLGLRIEMLEGWIDQLKDAVETSDRRATEFREDMRDNVEHVIAESPNLEWVRNVLFAPIVEFNEVWLGLAQQAVNIINAKIGHSNWTFAAIGVSASGSHSFVAAIEDRTKPDAHWLLFYDPDTDLDAEAGDEQNSRSRQGRALSKAREHAEAGDEQNSKSAGKMIRTKLKLRGIFPSSAPKKLLVATQDGQLTLVSAEAPLQERVVVGGLQVEDDIFPVTIEKEDLALIVRRTPAGFDISCSDYASGKDPERIYQLPGNTDKALWAFHSQSARILAAIKRERRWRLYFLQFSSPPPESKDNPPQRQPQPKLACWRDERDLPPKLTPKQILALSAEETLIVDKEGNLHYWHKTRPVPIKLKHASWPLDPDSKLLAGANGWIAVAAHGHLTMWRIQRGGRLSPYEQLPGGFAIHGVSNDSLVATWDGRYLLAVKEKLVSIWEFPRYAVDEFK